MNKTDVTSELIAVLGIICTPRIVMEMDVQVSPPRIID